MEKEDVVRNNNNRSLTKIQKAEKMRTQQNNTSMTIQQQQLKGENDNYNQVVDNRRRNLTTLNENLVSQSHDSQKSGAIHATDNKKPTHKLISNRQKRAVNRSS